MLISLPTVLYIILYLSIKNYLVYSHNPVKYITINIHNLPLNFGHQKAMNHWLACKV